MTSSDVDEHRVCTRRRHTQLGHFADTHSLHQQPRSHHLRAQTLQVNSALRPSGVAKSSTSFGWGKGGNVTSAGWQVTLCDPMWRSRSGVATLRTAIHLLLTYLLTEAPCAAGMHTVHSAGTWPRSQGRPAGVRTPRLGLTSVSPRPCLGLASVSWISASVSPRSRLGLASVSWISASASPWSRLGLGLECLVHIIATATCEIWASRDTSHKVEIVLPRRV